MNHDFSLFLLPIITKHILSLKKVLYFFQLNNLSIKYPTVIVTNILMANLYKNI